MDSKRRESYFNSKSLHATAGKTAGMEARARTTSWAASACRDFELKAPEFYEAMAKTGAPLARSAAEMCQLTSEKIHPACRMEAIHAADVAAAYACVTATS